PTHALWQVMIHADDQPELFMTLCEAFERLGFSIQDAQIYTNPQGWVVDTFVVQVAAAIDEEQQGPALLINTLKESVRMLKDQKNTPQARTFSYHDARSDQARVFPLTPSAQLRHLQNSSWELSVLGTDRKGLLFDLSQFFAKHKLNLRSAKIMTQGERVEDSFILASHKLENNKFRATLIRHILRLLTWSLVHFNVCICFQVEIFLPLCVFSLIRNRHDFFSNRLIFLACTWYGSLCDVCLPAPNFSAGVYFCI